MHSNLCQPSSAAICNLPLPFGSPRLLFGNAIFLLHFLLLLLLLEKKIPPLLESKSITTPFFSSQVRSSRDREQDRFTGHRLPSSFLHPSRGFGKLIKIFASAGREWWAARG